MPAAAPAVPFSAGAGPSMEDLYSALEAADKAGNTADAQQLAAAIQAGQTQQTTDQTTGSTSQYTGLLRQPLRLGSKLLEGAADLADLPGNISRVGSQLLTSGANMLTGANIPAPSDARTKLPGIGEVGLGVPSLVAGTNALGVTNNPRLTPQSLTEKLTGAAAQALPMAAPVIASGGAILPAVATTTAAGTAAESAHEVAPNSILAPIIAGMAGGYGVGSIDRMISTASKVKSARAALDSATQEFEAFKDALPTSRFDLGQTYKDATTAAKNNYQAFKTAALAERDAVVDGVTGTVKAVADKLAPKAQTLEDAGAELQGAARRWLGETLPSKVSALWKPVDSAIPADAPVELNGFSNALKAINSSAGKLEPVAGLLKPSLPKQIGKTLAGLTEAPAELGVPQAPFTWAEVAKLRTTLGDAMSNPVTVKDIGSQNLSRLYATLTGDMRSVAKAHGADDLFDSANAGSTQLFGIGEGPMAKLVSGKTVDRAADQLPGAVAKNLLSAGIKDSGDLATLRAELGPALDHLGSVALRTGAWEKLHPGSKEALLTNAESRGAVDLALGSKDSANEALSKALSDGNAQHQQNMSIADLAKRQGNLQLNNSMRSLGKAKVSAKESVEAFKADRGKALSHGVQGLTGLGAGGELGILGLNALGLPGSDIVHGALGATAGLIIPPLVRGVTRGVKNAITDPASLRYPALGATTAAGWLPTTNALTGATN